MLEAFAGSGSGYCIGVDIDQWNDHPELHSCLVSSAIKRLDTTLEKVLGYAVEDKFISGTYKGEGGLAPFHDFDEIITDDIRTKLNEIQMMMYTGEIQP
jgi:basic membrane protein A